jgi:DNA-binding transcriptional LysR family regulator
LPDGHKLAHADAISLASLVGESFVAWPLETDTGLHRHLSALSQTGRFTLRIGGRAPDMLAIITMVATGFGIAAVPQSITCLQIPGVTYRPLAQEVSADELAAAFRRDERTPAVKAFIQHLKKLSSEAMVAPAGGVARAARGISRGNARQVNSAAAD